MIRARILAALIGPSAGKRRGRYSLAAWLGLNAAGIALTVAHYRRERRFDRHATQALRIVGGRR